MAFFQSLVLDRGTVCSLLSKAFISVLLNQGDFIFAVFCMSFMHGPATFFI